MILRAAILVHRWLGIGFGLMMVVWCLSGVVMMYVPYPSLPAARRLAALEPLALAGFHGISAEGLADGDRVEKFSVEMHAGRPVLRITREAGASVLVDLVDGRPRGAVTEGEASSVAGRFEQATATLDATLEKIRDDPWTLWGVADADRPLYRAALDDGAGTEIYVSSTSGVAVQATTARLRFWNRLGSIPHWLYLTSLRRHHELWTAVVVWVSLLGTLLALLGLVVGVAQIDRTRLSPYRGLLRWHHVPGLFFGLFTLSWIASGFASMSPWGLLDASSDSAERASIEGDPPRGADVKRAISALSHAAILHASADVVSVESSRFGGRLYVIATTASGARSRVDASGAPAALAPTDVDLIAMTLGGKADLLDHEDTYYFAHHSPVVLPVYRVVAGDAEHIRYYVDTVSGAILRKVDGNARRYRWLHEAAHRLDFSALLRTRPIWDFVMLALMSGVTAVTATGAWLGVRRVARSLFRASASR